MENKIFIFTDNTSDYPSSLLEKEKDIDILPLSVGLGEDEYDFITTSISIKEFYDRLAAGEKPHTSMINEVYSTERFKKALDAGFDVIYVCFSQALSGTYDLACRILDGLRPKYPKQKITVINSKQGSTGEGLLLHYVLQKRAEGMSYDEIVKFAYGLVDNVCNYFTVGDLKHAAKMGRVNKSVAFIANIIKIFPLMYVNIFGELVPFEKIITRKKLLNSMVNKMKEKMWDISKQDVIIIGHSDSIQDAQYVQKLVLENFPTANVMINDIGHIIGCHGGNGNICLAFLGKDKLEPKDARVAEYFKKS